MTSTSNSSPVISSNSSYSFPHSRAVPRLSHVEMNSSLLASHVASNSPLIIAGFPHSSPSISSLSDLFGSAPLRNALQSNDGVGRFKYAKRQQTQTGQKQSQNQHETSASAMPLSIPCDFPSFVQLSSASYSSSPSSPIPLFHYLYGEPLNSASLSSLLCTPAYFDSMCLNSPLLWLSLNSTTSPLHYDLTDGFLFQLHGAKEVILFNSSEFEKFRPHELDSTFDRQANIADIRNEPEIADLECHHAILQSGDCLFLPFGWWHEVRTSASPDEFSLTLTLRENRFEEKLQSVALLEHKCASERVPIPIARMLLSAALDDSGLPEFVSRAFKRRAKVFQ